MTERDATVFAIAAAHQRYVRLRGCECSPRIQVLADDEHVQVRAEHDPTCPTTLSGPVHCKILFPLSGDHEEEVAS